VFDRAVGNDEAATERRLDDPGDGSALVIDQPGSIGALASRSSAGAGSRSPMCPAG
jgi:hypothetical protein